MRTLSYIVLIFAGIAMFVSNADAQQMVWRPKNPAFGGNPQNYFWMMQSAEAQNKLTKPRDVDRFIRDPLADFEASFQRQLLNQLSRQLMGDMFGEVGMEEGRYEFGNFIIEVMPGADGLEVHIWDMSTGGETSIIVPYF